MSFRGFGFQFRDSLFQGSVDGQSFHIYYLNKEYSSIQEFINDVKPTEEEAQFLQEKTNHLLSRQ